MLSDKRRSSSTTSTRTRLAPQVGIPDHTPDPDMTFSVFRDAIVLQADGIVHRMSLYVAGGSQLGFCFIELSSNREKTQMECVIMSAGVCVTTHARQAFGASAFRRT